MTETNGSTGLQLWYHLNCIPKQAAVVGLLSVVATVLGLLSCLFHCITLFSAMPGVCSSGNREQQERWVPVYLLLKAIKAPCSFCCDVAVCRVVAVGMRAGHLQVAFRPAMRSRAVQTSSALLLNRMPECASHP